MGSWQATAMSFVLRHLFKPRLVRAEDAAAARKVMSGPPVPPLRGSRVESAVLGGVRGEWLLADDVPVHGTMLYLHGGGYFACSPQTHRAVTSFFPLAGLRTFAADYRLAPEHPFPAGLDDAVSSYRALLGEVDAQEIVVGGDSAGGGLCMALLLSLREKGLPMPAAAVLFSPFVDLAASGESITRNSVRCAMFRSDLFARAARFYVGDAGDARAPLVSPLYADLHGLPPLLIHVGEDETLLDDSRRLAARAQHAGVSVELKLWPRVPHAWQLFHRLVPEGRASLGEACDFLARQLRAESKRAA